MALRIPSRLSRRFTLYADDTGQPDIRPTNDGKRYVFAYGGVVVANDKIPHMQRGWSSIKSEFFTTTDEVKAADFVRDDSPISAISDTLDRRKLAQGMLAEMMRMLELRPVGCFIDKAEVPGLFLVKDGLGNPKQTRLGNVQLDKKYLLETIAVAFSAFLQGKLGRGRMICDEPGQGKPEDWQRRFAEFRSYDQAFSRIDKLEFRRSSDEPGIQLADVAVGLMRYAQERREVIVDGLKDVLRHAQAEGLGIRHVQP